MKKRVDLHLHTVCTVTDYKFEFSLETLKNYVSDSNLDCIAITNHNLFDLEQYKLICGELDILVLPGIEVDLERGHMLVIANPTDIEDFDLKCKQLAEKVNPYPRAVNSDFDKPNISLDEFEDIFVDLRKYILIPHYDKTPKINKNILSKLSKLITAGEVQSAKKFIQIHSDETKLVPVYFSDERMSLGTEVQTSRHTFLDINELNFRSIKLSLGKRSLVSLTASDGNDYIEITNTGIRLSTRLNVVLGKRSSGKTHLLRLINNQSGEDQVKYIRQFELLELDDEKDKANFEEHISKNESSFSEKYLSQFKNVVDDILDVDILSEEKDIERYVDSLLENAQNQARSDVYSKTYLYNESKYNFKDSKTISDLIKSAQKLLDDNEYTSIVSKHITRKALLSLHFELVSEFKKEYKENHIENTTNDIVGHVKSLLNIKSTLKLVEDLDLRKIALNRAKKRKFEQLVNGIKSHKEIAQRDLYGYRVIAERGAFKNPTDLKQVTNFRVKLSPSFNEYHDPIKYILKLREAGIEDVEIYKFFSKITYRILNKFGTDVSGGERSEYRLLKLLSDAKNYDMLLIDEPESSFDNTFLLESINSIIKDLSSQMPVVLVTHNSTVGASIIPDNIIYTEKSFSDNNIRYDVYSGKPTDKYLISKNGKKTENYYVQINSLEAGSVPYEKRKKDYDDLKS